MEGSARSVQGVIRGVALAGGLMSMTLAPGMAATTEISTLEQGIFGPFGGRSFIVANSQGAWRQAMRSLEADGALAYLPAPEPPQGVDWTSEVVLMLAAGPTGYNPELVLVPAGRGRVKVEPRWVPLSPPVDCDGDGDIDGDDNCAVYLESFPYHLCKMPKHFWLQDVIAQGPEVDAVLPLEGNDDSVPVEFASWGRLKATYR